MRTLWEGAYFPAARGVDGDETSFFHTDVGRNTWWAVDLGEGGARVTTVRVVNRKACGESATQLDIKLTLAELKLKKATLGVILSEVVCVCVCVCVRVRVRVCEKATRSM